VSPISAEPVRVTGSQRRELGRLIRSGRSEQRLVARARIVLMAAERLPNAAIAAALGLVEDTVRKWRRRWNSEPGVAALGDAQRSGRPPRFTPVQVARVKAVACTPPGECGLALARWSCPELARHAAADGIDVSAATVRRWLAEDALKPWQHQSWIFRRDPDFEAKATVVLDLYQGFYQGKPLGPGDRILSIDAKPSIQARGRRHPGQASGRGRPARVEHEYVRHGALALLAALDVHTGQVIADCPATTGIAPFMSLVGTAMLRPRYRDADRVFVVVDNGSDHRGRAAIARLAAAHPNAVMIHTPIHASWLNQVEIFFSIVQRKVLTPNDFQSTEQLERTLRAFISRYNTTASQFKWRYTSNDLRQLLARTETEQPVTITQAA
jgi:transposase